MSNKYTRVGREIDVLSQVKNSLPLIFLDCEFWFGRGMFSSTHMLTSGSQTLVHWSFFRIVAFDIPSCEMENEPFERRYKTLLLNSLFDHSFLAIASRVECVGKKHVQNTIQGIIDDNGEGVILRKHSSLYEHGRTSNLVKLKTAQGDREGIVVSINDDNSVTLKLPEGNTFSVSPENVTLKNVIKVGDIVSFSFDNHARREIPVNPKIFRIRMDLEWDDVVLNSIQERKYLNKSSQSYTRKPVGHWTVKNMRLFLELFAKNRGMDPLSPETWYNTSGSIIRQERGGESVMSKLKMGYFKTIQSLFPEIPLHESDYRKSLAKAMSLDKENKEQIDIVHHGFQSFWQDIRNRRKFFEYYASGNSFDPLSPENWYSQPLSKIMATKGARRVILYHKSNVRQALLDLFPDIGLVKERLPFPPLWNDENNRRLFFEEYAKRKGMDPLCAENWYSQSRESITSIKGASGILSYYNGSISKALIHLFPSIGFEYNKFWYSKWSKEDNRKNFFTQFAKENYFNPNKAENWYNRKREDILSHKGGYSVISFHKFSVKQALVDLFPHVHFNKSLFWQKILWKKENRRREFFEEYAKKNGVDPKNANHWYTQPRDKITSVKGAASVLSFHNNSIPQALCDLFPDIDLVRSKFNATAIWPDMKRRKGFFDDYANDKKFDPLIPENWYSQFTQNIKAKKGSFMVLSFYNGSIAAALIDVYPNIGLQKQALMSHWRNNARTSRETFPYIT